MSYQHSKSEVLFGSVLLAAYAGAIIVTLALIVAVVVAIAIPPTPVQQLAPPYTASPIQGSSPNLQPTIIGLSLQGA